MDLNSFGLPDTIYLGAIDYTVEVVYNLTSSDGRERLAGEIASSEAKIRLDHNQDPQMARIALWHEMIHGILESAGYQNGHDERLIDALAHGVVELIKRNPALTKG